MQVDLGKFINSGEVVAVALSGGVDSMSLLYYLLEKADLFHFSVIALNIEHGIRGESSLSDSKFVKDYCASKKIPLLCYSVDSLKKANEDKLSVEQAARILRYECFQDAISAGKCDKIATAHHLSDNTESVLFNLFRGTGLSGLTGIKAEREDKIIRPFISVSKAEIETYAKENDVPFVVDETNLSTEYTRNYIRRKIVPEIKEIFPELDKSIFRLSEISQMENDFLNRLATDAVFSTEYGAKIQLPCDKAILARGVIVALKRLGISKDWESAHVNDVCLLVSKPNGASVSLPKGITAYKEYDGITFTKSQTALNAQIPFSLGSTVFGEQAITIKVLSDSNIDLTNGLYADLDKIPVDAVIRAKTQGDRFTKFGGGTKSLGDYLTDKKIPKRVRDNLPLLASEKDVLVIFGVAVSDKIKVDENTKTIIKFE
ncbi:MAG: tRNA lysidine(34) synthetase TilS [Clostridia bacterium]|nr:tRNA lysidine(34) synthetase TilS [Clostridia bacterium]